MNNQWKNAIWEMSDEEVMEFTYWQTLKNRVEKLVITALMNQQAYEITLGQIIKYVNAITDLLYRQKLYRDILDDDIILDRTSKIQMLNLLKEIHYQIGLNNDDYDILIDIPRVKFNPNQPPNQRGNHDNK